MVLFQGNVTVAFESHNMSLLVSHHDKLHIGTKTGYSPFVLGMGTA